MAESKGVVKGEADKIIDMHVHVVGNGSGGTGCWIRSSFWRGPMQSFMCRHIGLSEKALKGDLDRLFVEKLLEWVRDSSLDAAVILAHEQVYHEDGPLMKGKGTTYVPNDFVLDLADRHEEFLPAVSIHPARKDALEELGRCLERGAVMMKCLPNCQNIDCNDRRYTKFWERMAEAGLPLLAHTGGEHTVKVVRAEFVNPETMTLPLECGVNLIAAHAATKSGLFDPQYFPRLVRLMERFENLYFDNSAFNTPFRASVLKTCLQPGVVERAVHGSDYPVPIFGHWAWLRGSVDWKTFRELERNPNVLERDYQLKRAMGFPAESFTRINQLLRGVKR